MTIKAHLKTELKRRIAQTSTSSATPAAAAPTPTPAPGETPTVAEDASAIADTQEAANPGAITDATVEAANNESAVAPSIEQGDALHENVCIL